MRPVHLPSIFIVGETAQPFVEAHSEIMDFIFFALKISNDSNVQGRRMGVLSLLRPISLVRASVEDEVDPLKAHTGDD